MRKDNKSFGCDGLEISKTNTYNFVHIMISPAKLKKIQDSDVVLEKYDIFKIKFLYAVSSAKF